jgi:type VI secretion system protein ImpF
MIDFSVLDRLVADQPPPHRVAASSGEGRGGQRQATVSKAEFERYRAAVRRDLEWLLNTRKNADPLPEGLREVEKSVYAYGLPDFSEFSLSTERNAADQERLAGMIARTIEIFEPRILDVRVAIGNRASSSRDLHFHVLGRLKMKPRPEPVCYDTKLDVTRGEYAVGIVGDGRA